MTYEIFIGLFLVLAIADWWMDMVQRTTVLICRANSAPLSPVGELLNPAFIKFSFPITIAKWSLVGFWAWYGSVIEAVVPLVVAWFTTVVSPIPFELTLSPIVKQVARVQKVDTTMGDQLLQMIETWKALGARH